MQFFEMQAERFGFDKKAYLEAVSKVPIWSVEQLNLYVDFIKTFIDYQIKAGLAKIQEAEAKKIIEESENKFREMIKTTNDGFWIVDINGRFLEINEASCEISGYSREELLNMSVQDIEFLENQSDVQKRIERLVINGSERFESKHRRKNGEIIDVEISINYLCEEQTFFVFLHEITERKKKEKEFIEQIEEISRFNNLMIGREEKMIELKKEVNSLLIELGEDIKYKIDFDKG